MESQEVSGALEVERLVKERYSQGAAGRDEALCCPIDYDPRYLEAIPDEVKERDYGCGDPSRHVRPGDTVLDLGSGGGKICFIAAQIAGPDGSVVGIDMNDDMLALARRAAPEVARRLAYANVSFRRGRIQDLALDLDLVDAWLGKHPVDSAAGLSLLEDFCDRIRRERPLIPDGSVDVVVSNCVLNLVRESDKREMIREIFRVLKVGGRIAISDIVSDEPIPRHLKDDPDLWSGCISGAFQEREMLASLEEAGFHGITLDSWAEQPYRTVEGIEFRSITVTARKGKEGPCLEANEAVIYRGPFKQVEDDDHHVLRRGERTAVCAKTFALLTSEPYAAQIIPVPPRTEVPRDERLPFDCARTQPRHPRETKGRDCAISTETAGACGPSDGCC